MDEAQRDTQVEELERLDPQRMMSPVSCSFLKHTVPPGNLLRNLAQRFVRIAEGTILKAVPSVMLNLEHSKCGGSSAIGGDGS